MVLTNPDIGAIGNNNGSHENSLPCPHCGKVTSSENNECMFCGLELSLQKDEISPTDQYRQTNSSISLLLAIFGIAIWLCFIYGFCKWVQWIFKYIQIPRIF